MESERNDKKHRVLTYDTNYIPVLDGIRAVAVIIVVWFHFWQQSWLMPIWGDFNVDWIPRNGSILVDMMILLSGFCLFLPHARQMVYGEKTLSAGTFYHKRLARIAPSYFVCIFIVLFCFALPMGEYATEADMWKDLMPHMFFVHNLFPESTQFSHLNGALWTVGVEVQLYLMFPLLAKWFKKMPILTYCGMATVGFIACAYISKHFDTLNHSVYLNHTLTFLGVFANGMLGAWVYMTITKSRVRTKAEEFLFLVMSIVGMWLFKLACEDRMRYESDTKWQVDRRFLLSLLFLFILFSIIMSGRYLKWLFGNKVMKFLAGISFNLYIWHQYISVKLKEFKIPYWEGDTPPNQTGDKVWMWKYMILCIAVSFAVAIVMTYCVEKPLAKLIMRIGRKTKNKRAIPNHKQGV
jgi:peptidoglycan/LPS O-acetylase OafA/YrhL